MDRSVDLPRSGGSAQPERSGRQISSTELEKLLLDYAARGILPASGEFDTKFATGVVGKLPLHRTNPSIVRIEESHSGNSYLCEPSQITYFQVGRNAFQVQPTLRTAGISADQWGTASFSPDKKRSAPWLLSESQMKSTMFEAVRSLAESESVILTDANDREVIGIPRITKDQLIEFDSFTHGTVLLMDPDTEIKQIKKMGNGKPKMGFDTWRPSKEVSWSTPESCFGAMKNTSPGDVVTIVNAQGFRFQGTLVSFREEDGSFQLVNSKLAQKVYANVNEISKLEGILASDGKLQDESYFTRSVARWDKDQETSDREDLSALQIRQRERVVAKQAFDVMAPPVVGEKDSAPRSRSRFFQDSLTEIAERKYPGARIKMRTGKILAVRVTALEEDGSFDFHYLSDGKRVEIDQDSIEWIKKAADHKDGRAHLWRDVLARTEIGSKVVLSLKDEISDSEWILKSQTFHDNGAGIFEDRNGDSRVIYGGQIIEIISISAPGEFESLVVEENWRDVLKSNPLEGDQELPDVSNQQDELRSPKQSSRPVSPRHYVYPEEKRSEFTSPDRPTSPLIEGISTQSKYQTYDWIEHPYSKEVAKLAREIFDKIRDFREKPLGDITPDVTVLFKDGTSVTGLLFHGIGNGPFRILNVDQQVSYDFTPDHVLRIERGCSE